MFPTDSTPFSLQELFEHLHAAWELPRDAFTQLLHGESGVVNETPPSELAETRIQPSGCSGALVTLASRLASFHPTPAKQLQWLSTPQKDFESNTALNLMASSADELHWVAYYLDTSWRAYDLHQRSLGDTAAQKTAEP